MPLTSLKVKKAGPGKHADIHGLYLIVQPSGSRSWMLRYQHKGRRRDFGLGPVHDLPLAEARTAAMDIRKMVRAGIDPVEQRGLKRPSRPTFEVVARKCYEALRKGWKDRRNASWIASFENHVAIVRHSRIVRAMQFAQSIEAPYTDAQRAELRASRANLDGIRPDAARDLEAAMAAAPALVSQAAAGRTSNALQAMQLEAEMRGNPQLRADVFVQRWRALDRQRRQLLRDHEDTAARKVAGSMIGMAKNLGRDPQVESLLRNRKAELGLPGHTQGEGIGHSLGEMVGRTLGRGLGIGV